MKLIINNQEWGDIPPHALAVIQFYCAENDLLFNVNEKENRAEVKSPLYGKKVWLAVSAEYETLGNDIQKQVKATLAPHGIQVLMKGNHERVTDGDLLIELTYVKSSGEDPFISIGYNGKLNAINVKKILMYNQHSFRFKGYFLMPDEHDIPHLTCAVNSRNESLLIQEGSGILTSCILKALLGNRKPGLLHLDLLHFFQMGNSGGRKKEMDRAGKKHLQMDDKTYEELKKRKANRKPRETVEKKPHAEIYFDYNLLPNRKLERYSIKADFFIKNTGNVELMDPKICFRVNPAEKIEIGGQILPPEMSDIFSVQGQNGAQGWKYMGKDWLEKAYSTGEYWIEAINGTSIPPGETAVVEGLQFTVENLEEQESSTIIGFILCEEQGLQLSSNNKIMITF
ncbi:hypothetical protein [Bacillus sp. KH172YL63]|uniref:hypothetical protein n=1 Tax=Bacillus sp. KH172YL63 TaxID=2709784 RepID=UPI00156646C5|nr:hypothetical protein [Bacillus sp. KH172YL63]